MSNDKKINIRLPDHKTIFDAVDTKKISMKNIHG